MKTGDIRKISMSTSKNKTRELTKNHSATTRALTQEPRGTKGTDVANIKENSKFLFVCEQNAEEEKRIQFLSEQ